MNSPAVVAACQVTSKPEERSARNESSMSSVQSSKKSTRSGSAADFPSALFWESMTLLTLEGGLRWSLIYHQPVVTQAPDQAAELIEVHRLLNVAVHAEMITPDHVLFLPRRGQDNDRNRHRARLALDLLQYFQPIYFGKLQIEEDQL